MRVRHRKRFSLYDVIGEARVKSELPMSEGSVVVVYRAEEDGALWVRPPTEFNDGRFEDVTPRPGPRDGYPVWGVYDTDNAGGDYPDEKWIVGPGLRKATAEAVAKLINDDHGPGARRWYRVADRDYKLQPGFEP